MIDNKALHISLLKTLAAFFLEKNVRFVVVASHDLSSLASHSETEKWLTSLKFGHDGIGDRIDWLKNTPTHFDALYADIPEYSKAYIENIFEPIPNINTRRGRANLDYQSDYVNISNGFLQTTEQPQVYDHSVFVVGGSSVYGFGCEDKDTLPSLLQQRINQSAHLNSQYAVFNLGARGNPAFVDFHKLLSLTVLPHDVVIFQGIHQNIVKVLSYLNTDKLHFICPDFTDRKKVGEIFFDAGHITYKGHAMVAEQIFNQLFPTKVVNSSLGQQANIANLIDSEEKNLALQALAEFTQHFSSIHANIEKYPGLQDFIHSLKLLSKRQGILGATVVNCNPFTLGHRHLIEHAASKVDHLYVFVVEENLSYFPFKDRFSMVIEGVKDIVNVTVIPSGKYIMSTLTYPDYFSKEEQQAVNLDASTDMDIFGEYIASSLNISVRFIGEEPHCNVTRQHNNQMRNILPTYGIRVEEIVRVPIKNQVVSASLVRRYIQSNEIDKIQELVPPSTFRYIQSQFYCKK